MIKFRRQGGGQSSSEAAKVPSTLAYGEPAIASDGTLYVGDGKGGVIPVPKIEFSGKYLLDGWQQEDSAFTQTISVSSNHGGVKMASTLKLGPPMTTQTDNFDTNEKKLEALGIVNSGQCIPGDGTVTIKCREKPSCDLDVHWEVQF